MRKICIVLSAVMLLVALSGCNILETDNPPTLPKLVLDASTITGTVEYVNGYTCRIQVMEGDGHYDGPRQNSKGEDVPGDTIYLTYTSLSGAKNVSVGDTVTVSYRYTRDVSERNGEPHITVNILQVKS